MRPAPVRLLLLSTLVACALLPELVVAQVPSSGCVATFCFEDPCKSKNCTAKCAAYQDPNVQCVNDFCGGCNCNCVLPAKAPCSDAGDAAPCAKGLVCDQTNACVVNPFIAECPTICVPEEEAAKSCKSAGKACVPFNSQSSQSKPQCCEGLGCHYSKSAEQYICSRCQKLGADCETRPCCPFLSCQEKDKGTFVCKGSL